MAGKKDIKGTIERRRSALKKKREAAGSAAGKDKPRAARAARSTRKQLKRAQRKLRKLNRASAPGKASTES